VVDEDAGQLVTDGQVHERCRDGGVDTAGQPAQHPRVADLGADALHLLGDDGARRPVGLDRRTPTQEVLQHLLAERRVPHLRVPLDAEQAPRRVLERRHR
jgi:hypothetical protein